MPDVTAATLIDEVIGLLLTETGDADQVTTLNSALDPAGTSFTVTDVRSGTLGLTPGVVEIGTELLWVTAVGNDGTVTVAPWGRGFKGTTAAAHNTGDRVTSQPAFPRYVVLDKLNQTLLRVFPKIFQPKVVTLTTTYPRYTYDLPEDAAFTIDARWLVPNGYNAWRGVERWRDSRGGTTVAGDPGVSVDVGDVMTPGQPIEFTYAASPTQFTSESDLFSVTGLADSMRDVIVTGAAALLTTGQEISRLQQSTIEQQDRARLVPTSAALTTSRFLEQKYQLRLAEEVAALRTKYPIRMRRTWT